MHHRNKVSRKLARNQQPVKIFAEDGTMEAVETSALEEGPIDAT